MKNDNKNCALKKLHFLQIFTVSTVIFSYPSAFPYFFKPNVKSTLPGLSKPFIRKQLKEEILSFPIERPPIIKNFFIWKNVKDSLQAAEKFCRDLATQE
jgi:hypothetical protein